MPMKLVGTHKMFGFDSRVAAFKQTPNASVEKNEPAIQIISIYLRKRTVGTLVCFY